MNIRINLINLKSYLTHLCISYILILSSRLEPDFCIRTSKKNKNQIVSAICSFIHSTMTQYLHANLNCIYPYTISYSARDPDVR